MTNTSTASRTKVVGTFDTAGASDAITATGAKLVDVSVDFVTNSFAGTIQLQRQTNVGAANVSQWVTIEEYTASAERVAQSATTRRYRLNCSVASSGTAEFELASGNRE